MKTIGMKTIGLILTCSGLILAGLCEVPDIFAFSNNSRDELEIRISQEAGIVDLLAYAYQENPSIREAGQEWLAVVESYRVATGYPDPLLIVTYFPEPIETRLGPQDWNLTLSQMIPFPGKLSKAGEIVRVEARISRLKLDIDVREVMTGVRESFNELWYIREAKKVADHNAQLLEHLQKVAETAYAEDRTIFMDVVKAQSQMGQLRYDILLLEELEATEIAMLNGILNRIPEAAIGQLRQEHVVPLAYALDDIYRMAETYREEIRMAGLDVEKAEKKVDLAKYENLPEFRIGISYAGIGRPDVPVPPRDEGTDAFGVQAGVTIPLWFGKNRGRTARALAEVEKAKAAKTVRVNETLTNVRAVYFRLENSRRLMELYQKDLLPQAAKAMQIAETWFREKESTFSDFVETQAVWYNFNLAFARARADYGKNLARLERLVGQSLTAAAADRDVRKEVP